MSTLSECSYSRVKDWRVKERNIRVMRWVLNHDFGCAHESPWDLETEVAGVICGHPGECPPHVNRFYMKRSEPFHWFACYKP